MQIRSLLDTILVEHPDLGLMYQGCEVLLRLLTLEYSWVASMDEKRRLAALQACGACFREIAGMLVCAMRLASESPMHSGNASANASSMLLIRHA